MRFRIKGEDGNALDATVELQANAIVLHSRGGTRGTPSSQNQEYSVALRLILQRLETYGRAMRGVWVDSREVQSLPLAERQIFFATDSATDAMARFSLLGKRMERVGQAAGFNPNKGNRNKRLRIEVATGSVGELASVIGAKPQGDVPRSALRLPATDLYKVAEHHIWSAIEKLATGAAEHGFDDSLGYDLVTEAGTRLPPKAVFGLAASQALGFPVQPVNFTGGAGTVCFDVLQSAGWKIIRKEYRVSRNVSGLNADDRAWAEGDERRLSHLRRERHAGVAKAKKAEMRALHGKLFCEQCQMDPVAQFGSIDGEACIEVHHRDKQVAFMKKGHLTKLADVECLCANCHRVRHREMKNAQKAAVLATPA